MRKIESLLASHGLKIAFGMWVISLVMPTGLNPEIENGYESGFAFLQQGFIAMVMWIAFVFGYPLHFLAWVSNFALFWCAIELTAPKSAAPIRRAKIILALALCVDLAIGFVFGWPNASGYGAIPKLLGSPAYWCWIAAFATAFWTAIVTIPITSGGNVKS